MIVCNCWCYQTSLPEFHSLCLSLSLPHAALPLVGFTFYFGGGRGLFCVMPSKIPFNLISIFQTWLHFLPPCLCTAFFAKVITSWTNKCSRSASCFPTLRASLSIQLALVPFLAFRTNVAQLKISWHFIFNIDFSHTIHILKRDKPSIKGSSMTIRFAGCLWVFLIFAARRASERVFVCAVHKGRGSVSAKGKTCYYGYYR